MIELTIDAGFLPLLPYDLKNAKKLAVPPAFAKDADWFAVPLWTVVKGLPLKFEDR